MPSWHNGLIGDRIQLNAILIVLSFVFVLALDSQSAASYPTYFLALSMALAAGRWKDVWSVGYAWCILGLLSYLCLSSFWSEPSSWRDALGVFGRGALVFFFVVALAESQPRGQVQFWLGRALTVVGTIAALAAIVAFVQNPPHDDRLDGLWQLEHTVVAGLIFGAALILLLDVVIGDPVRGWKLVGILGALAVGSAVVLSDSRNALVGATIGCLVLGFSHAIVDKRRFASAFAVSAVVAIAIVGSLLTTTQGVELLFPRGDSFRPDIWSRVLERIVPDHVLFGLGILTPDAVPVGERVFSHPHNMYLAVFFQGGLLGVLLFITLIGWSFIQLLAEYEQRSAKLALGLLSMALTSYLLDGHELIDKVGETWFLFWLPVGISLGLAWRRRFQEQSDPPGGPVTIGERNTPSAWQESS